MERPADGPIVVPLGEELLASADAQEARVVGCDHHAVSIPAEWAIEATDLGTCG